MKVVFRVDSSHYLGIGHVMRCFVLANMIRRKGGQVIFLARKLPGNINDLIREEGYTLYELPPLGISSHKQNIDEIHHMEFSWKEDVEEVRNVLISLDHEIDCLILDHYAFDYKWEGELRTYVRKLIVIDDQIKLFHDCDVIINPDCQGVEMEMCQRERVPADCRMFVGPSYAFLRDEFLQHPELRRVRKGEVSRLFICFGGSDDTNETSKVLDALMSIPKCENMSVDAVVGISNCFQEQIERKIKGFKYGRYFCQSNRVAELMAEADLAVGGGGMMMWERIYLGLPSMTTITAKNQQEMVCYLGQQGCLTNLGPSSATTVESYQKSTAEILLESSLREKQSEKCLEIFNESKIKSFLSSLMDVLNK